jgi:uncharacterized protein YciI
MNRNGAKAFLGSMLLLSQWLAPEASGKGPMDTKSPTRTFTLTYAGGPQWKAGLPPEKQEIGGHFQYAKKLFDDHKLLANGHLANGTGFYVFVAKSFDEIEKIASGDPGIDSGVLQVQAAASWTLMFDNLAADVGGKQLFVLNYRPGPAWQAGKTLLQQPVAAHIGYVQSAFQAGTVLAGGPVDDHQGRYIVAAADQAAVDRWVQSDPGITAGIFRAEVIGWQPFNRQGARH